MPPAPGTSPKLGTLVATAPHQMSTEGSDKDKALRELGSPTKSAFPKKFEFSANDVCLQLDDTTGLPKGDATINNTLLSWRQESERAINALQQVPENSEHFQSAKEKIDDMHSTRQVIDGLMTTIAGKAVGPDRLDPESRNIMITTSHGSSVQSISHIVIEDGGKATIKNLVSNPRNNFDLDGVGGVRGAGKKALEVIKSEATHQGCSHISLISLTEKSTRFYAHNGFVKSLDYVPDDSQPEMEMFLKK